MRRIKRGSTKWILTGLMAWGITAAGCGNSPSGTDIDPTRPGTPASSSSSSSSSGKLGSGSSSGGNPGSVSGTSSTSSSSSSSGDTAASMGIGARHFSEQCVGCHAVTDQTLVKTFTLAQLTAAIDATMPLLMPDNCQGDCASSVALYIADENPFFGAVVTPAPEIDPDLVMPAVGEVDAAPVAIRRLNRAEYNNTVRDLLGTQLSPADSFPEDDFGYGFNNIAKVLSVSLTHLEQYLAATDVLVEEALEKAFSGRTQRFEAESQSGTHVRMDASEAVLNRGDSVLHLTLPVVAGGTHRLTVRAGQQAGGSEAARMVLKLDGAQVAAQSVAAPSTAMVEYAFDVTLTAGNRALDVAFTNDYWVEGEADRNLVVDWVAFSNLAARDTQVIACDPGSGRTCAAETARGFGLRAWRRPLLQAEVDRLLALYDAAAEPRAGFGQILSALLLSPNFFYRAELDSSLASATARALSNFELASRLSYFLWASTPDSTLLDLAADNRLTGDEVLRAQVARMLDDPRAATLIEQFAVQWLKFDKVLEAHPAADLFPQFNPQLMTSMRQETRLLLRDWLAQNLPVAELLAADYTYLNGPLAAHYGVAGISGSEFVRHSWQTGERRGILGHGAILTATSHPSNTSPVRRGVWVLENLTCQAPPPPPPGVENLADDNLEGLTTRERFELHRDSSSVCYSCHAMMDPIGFGLENFDPVGGWRTQEGGRAVDASGVLPSGEIFAGPLELSEVLAESPRLPLCLTQHLLTYALGRGVEALDDAGDGIEPPDYPAVYQIFANTRTGGHRIRDIITEIVLSDAFRSRRGADSDGGAL